MQLCVVLLLACKYVHVVAPCLLLRHSFGVLAALAAITGMTWPNVARRSVDYTVKIILHAPSLTHMRMEAETSVTD